MADALLLGRYQVGRLPVAHNGMGEVWPARDTSLDRDVIVKSVNIGTADAGALRRFRREALLTARMQHPGVPAVFDVGVHKGRPFLVLQRVDGVTLADLTAEQDPLSVSWVTAIGAQISSVLIAAQNLGLVHRDLKPANVMLEPSGAVKVLDFGLAVIRDDERYSRITRSGDSLGTVGYMAPEQILGEPTDHRTDLYGLGGTLFHLLTDKPPFDGATTMTTVRHQLSEPQPRPAQLRRDIPQPLDDLVHALLARHPEDRPQSAADVYDALAALCGELPPIPGVVTAGFDPVRSYAAIVGRTTTRRAWAPPVQTRSTALDEAAAEAQQLFTAGRYRMAARRWRQLVEEHGPDHPTAFEWRLCTARAHVRLGERDRAARILNDLLKDRGHSDDMEHPAVAALRAEIAGMPHGRPDTG